MSRFKTVTAILKELVKSPKSLKSVIAANYEEDMRQYVAHTYGCNRGLPTLDLLDLLPHFEETIDPYSFLEGQATLPDLVLLKGLARQRPDCRYLEIGTWRGESLANVASVAREAVSISLSDQEMRAMHFSASFIHTHGFFSSALQNVRYIAHNSHTLDYATLEGKFDVVFIDGDHSRQGVTIDTKNVFSLLRNDQSVIVWHDYGHGPETVRWDVLAGILDGTPQWARGSLYHVSNTVCAIYIKGEFPTKYTTLFQIPDKVFTIKVAARHISNE